MYGAEPYQDPYTGQIYENIWLIMIPPTQITGTATLDVQATDLADNPVTPTVSLNFHYSSFRNSARDWRLYK
jgi:hypothetical protein